MLDKEFLDQCKVKLLDSVPLDRDFRCYNEEKLDTLRCGEFFRTDVQKYHDKRFGRTIVLVNERKIIAYATLSVGHLLNDDLYHHEDEEDYEDDINEDFYPALIGCIIEHSLSVTLIISRKTLMY